MVRTVDCPLISAPELVVMLVAPLMSGVAFAMVKVKAEEDDLL